MTAASRSPLLSDWRDMASFGEQIVSASSLTAQHDRIIAVVSNLVEGDVNIWLQENLFRLHRGIRIGCGRSDVGETRCHALESDESS